MSVGGQLQAGVHNQQGKHLALQDERFSPSCVDEVPVNHSMVWGAADELRAYDFFAQCVCRPHLDQMFVQSYDGKILGKEGDMTVWTGLPSAYAPGVGCITLFITRDHCMTVIPALRDWV